MFLTKTFVVEDCYLYDTTEHSKTFTSSTASNKIIDTLSWSNTDDWSCCYDLKVSANGKRVDIVPPTESLNHHLGLGKQSGGTLCSYVGKASSGETAQNHTQTMNNNTYYSIEVKKVGTTVSFIYEGTTIRSESVTWLSNYSLEGINYTSWSTSGTIYVKNLKIKPL